MDEIGKWLPKKDGIAIFGMNIDVYGWICVFFPMLYILKDGASFLISKLVGIGAILEIGKQ